jgi:hypothetical protein
MSNNIITASWIQANKECVHIYTHTCTHVHVQAQSKEQCERLYNITCAIQQCRVSSLEHAQKAKKLICQRGTTSNEPIVLLDLLLSLVHRKLGGGGGA